MCVLSCVKLLETPSLKCYYMDYSLKCYSVHRISQARILSGLPFPTPEDLSKPGFKSESLVSPALAGGIFTIWEASLNKYYYLNHIINTVYFAPSPVIYYFIECMIVFLNIKKKKLFSKAYKSLQRSIIHDFKTNIFYVLILLE